MMTGNDKTPKTPAGGTTLRDGISMPRASEGLIARIMADAEETLAPKSWQVILWPFGPVWKPATVLMASALVGVWVGSQVLPEDGNTITNEIETMIVR